MEGSDDGELYLANQRKVQVLMEKGDQAFSDVES